VSNTPEDLYYAATHEWLKLDDDGTATVGVTDFAQSELGDLVFVELPEMGSQVSARDEVSVVESVKTASDICAPVSGEVIEVNEALQDAPELINSVPYDGGWIFKLRVSDEEELADLLSAEEYIEAQE
jgi:glycine cleavage system H protein